MKPIGRIYKRPIGGKKMHGSSVLVGLILLFVWGVVLVSATTVAAATIAAGQSEGWQVGFITASMLALLTIATKAWKDSI